MDTLFNIHKTFGYVAIALNILDLMVVERVSTSHTVADTVNTEVAGPLNDIASDANSLIEEYIGHDELRQKMIQEGVQAVIAKARAGVTVERYNPDGTVAKAADATPAAPASPPAGVVVKPAAPAAKP